MKSGIHALSALLFLYREVLSIELPWMDTIVRAKRPQRVPVVLSRDEVSRLLALMDGCFGLMASLLYGSGMRLMECVRLRVKDVDFELNQICVRDGKAAKTGMCHCRNGYASSCERNWSGSG